MYSKFLLLSLCFASAAGAQVHTKAKELANRTVATANARTDALGADQQAAAAPRGQRADTAQQGAQGAPAVANTQQAMVNGISREVFQYDGGARRDPFLSLSKSGALRPHITELELVVVIRQMNGAKAVATIKDNSTKEQYLVKVGDSLGRYRVVQIDSKAVTFAIEEFGFSRQEKLAMTDTTKVRNQ